MITLSIALHGKTITNYPEPGYVVINYNGTLITQYYTNKNGSQGKHFALVNTLGQEYINTLNNSCVIS